MKYFGQFLISKGLISEDVLVDTLIEQITGLPTVLELIRKNNLLNSATLLEVFEFQIEKQLEFKQACVELGKWTDEMEIKVKGELEKIRVPLGHLLIKKGATSLEEMTKALDEFLSKVELPSTSQKSTSIESISIEKKIEPELLNEFFSYLTDERLQEMDFLFSEIGKETVTLDSENLEALQKKIFNEIRALRGLLKFICLNKLENFVSKTEELLFISITQASQGDVHLLPILSKLGKVQVGLLKVIKDDLIQFKSETACLENADRSSQFNEVLNKLNDLYESEKA